MHTYHHGVYELVPEAKPEAVEGLLQTWRWQIVSRCAVQVTYLTCVRARASMKARGRPRRVNFLEATFIVTQHSLGVFERMGE